ncbi:UNVERIFIED_CONTAM: hypothetical protein RMT77_018171 [Armadillidium vulgare]
MGAKLEDFKFIQYDLSQNMIHGNYIFNLKNRILLSLISNHYKRCDIIEEIVTMRRERNFLGKWDPLERRITEAVKNQIKNQVKNHVKSFSLNQVISITIKLVGSGINSLFYKLYSEDEFRLVLQKLVFNNEDGSINFYNTFLKILYESDELSNEFKFEFACKYFVGKDIIVNYMMLLPQSKRFPNIYCKNETCERCVPLEFWESYIRKDEMMESTISDDSLKIYHKSFHTMLNIKFPSLFKWAVGSLNELAVQFLWENLSPSEEEIQKCGKDCTGELFKYGMANINAYLISKTQCKFSSFWDIDDIEDGDIFLEDFFRNTRWHRYIVHILKAIKETIPFSYVTQCTNLVLALKASLSQNLETRMYRDLLEEFVRIIPTQENIMSSFEELKNDILFPVLRSMDYEALEILMNIYKEKNIVCHLNTSNSALNLYNMQILECDFQNIEEFLKKIYKTPKKMSKFLIRIIEKKFNSLCRDFLLNENLDALAKFLIWCTKFFISKDLDKMKKMFPYDGNGVIVRSIILRMDNKIQNPFEYFDRALLMFFETINLVSEFKQNIIISASNLWLYEDFRIGCQLLRFELLDEIFRWSGCDYSDILELKSLMLLDIRIFKYFCVTNDHGGYWKFLEWVSTDNM